MAGFSKSEAIKFGWDITKKNIYFFIKVFLLINAILLSLLSLREFFKNISLLNFSFSLLITILEMIFSLGFIKIALKFYDNEKPEIYDVFFFKYRIFLKVFLASILYLIVVVFGLLLLIVPGIIFAIRLWFFEYFIVDKNLGVIESLKKSWEITKGNALNLFFFLILLALINILGFLALIIGLFLLIPILFLAPAFVYQKFLALIIGLFLLIPILFLAQAFVYRKLSENLQLKNQEDQNFYQQ